MHFLTVGQMENHNHVSNQTDDPITGGCSFQACAKGILQDLQGCLIRDKLLPIYLCNPELFYAGKRGFRSKQVFVFVNREFALEPLICSAPTGSCACISL